MAQLMPKKVTHEEMVDRFAAQGLQLLERYTKAVTKVFSRCVTCGYEWRVVPFSITRGSGCPRCTNRLPLSQSEVMARFNAKGLELLEPYVNDRTPVLIRCKYKHERSVYPGTILRRDSAGCPDCFYQRNGKAKRLTESEAALRFSRRQLEMLDNYLHKDKKVRTRCLKCRYEWQVKPGNIFNGQGCPKCVHSNNVEKRRFSHGEFISKMAAIHPNIEVNSQYKGALQRIAVMCTTCFYQWSPVAYSLARGCGCPKCAITGFRTDKPGTLYYVRVTNPFGDPLYKIGITNKTVRKRFSGEYSKIVVIETWHFPNGAEAFEMEQDILNDYDADRWTGPDILRDGNDELFTMDVLGLDKGAGQLELVA